MRNCWKIAFLYCYGTQFEKSPVSLVDVQHSPLKSLKMCCCIFTRTQFSMLPGPVSSNVILTRLKEQRPENDSQPVLLKHFHISAGTLPPRSLTEGLVSASSFVLSLSVPHCHVRIKYMPRGDSQAMSVVITRWISHY